MPVTTTLPISPSLSVSLSANQTIKDLSYVETEFPVGASAEDILYQVTNLSGPKSINIGHIPVIKKIIATSPGKDASVNIQTNDGVSPASGIVLNFTGVLIYCPQESWSPAITAVSFSSLSSTPHDIKVKILG